MPRSLQATLGLALGIVGALLACSATEAADESDAAADVALDAEVDADATDAPDLSLGDEGPREGLLPHTHDGRLHAAAGKAIITPSEANHPCVLLLGGTGSNRRAEGIHTELEARALVLAQDDAHLALVVMDLVGWLAPDTDRVRQALAERGLDPMHVVVASTHTHNAPDTIGVWGPEVNVSGRCPAYADFLVQTVVDLVAEVAVELRPATLETAEAQVDVAGASPSNLLVDYREPQAVNEHLGTARFVDAEGGTIASLINYHGHPEAMIHTKLISADLPHWTRRRLEQTFGGTALHLSGTVGGLSTILDVDLPAYTEGGEPRSEGGQPVILTEDGEQKAWSAGYLLADAAIEALEQATVETGTLRVDAVEVPGPLTNPMMILGFAGGILPAYDRWQKDDPDTCGSFGCMPLHLLHARLGGWHLITLPGELFAESSVGRPASTHDFGEREGVTYGPFDFPAMSGYRDALPAGHRLMEVGLANNEIGYLVPESDFHASDHPGYYEEYFCISKEAEATVRAGVRDLLAAP